MDRLLKLTTKLSLVFGLSILTGIAIVNSIGDHENPINFQWSPNAKPSKETTANPKSGCGQQPFERALMLVSTLDGKLSALNIEKDGKIEWSLDAGSSPLLSSTISNIEVTKDNVKARLIPSLDGSVYQFDGENVEPMPFTADTLLSSSFRFSEDSTIVGGKDSVTYGVDPATGQVRYICSSDGCKYFGGNGASLKNQKELLIITRYTKTVRSVEMMTGTERWNFSVGHHHVTYFKNSQADTITKSSTMEDEWDDVTIRSCDEFGEEEEGDDWSDFTSWFHNKPASEDMNLKVVIPKGHVTAVDKFNPEIKYWEHKFECPIAGAWTLSRSGTLETVSLFDSRSVPALEVHQGQISMDGDIGAQLEVPQEPLMYVGIHNEQLYVQPSTDLSDAVKQVLADSIQEAPTITTTTMPMPKVRWRPYLATARSRTPLNALHKNPLQLTWVKLDEDESEENKNRIIQQKENDVELAEWHDQYPFDGGFYLFPDTSPADLSPFLQNNSYLYINNAVIMSSYTWWKQVIATSLFMAFVIHFAINKHLTEKSVQLLRVDSKVSTTGTEMSLSYSLESQESNENEAKPKQFESRFSKEFECKSCLGKGGFGVVFSAVNKMDETTYAVKRIALNNSQKARKKVLREVKTLAQLDHPGIVRYFNSWYENPPPGWQEERDRENLDFSSTVPSAVQPSTSNSKRISTEFTSHNLEKKPSSDKLAMNYNPLKITGASVGFEYSHTGGFSNTGWTETSGDSRTVSSQARHSLVQSSGDKNGDNSVSFGSPITNTDLFQSQYGNESFSIQFQNSQTNSSNEDINFSKPFRVYEEDSNMFSHSVLFEDSGCDEHESPEASYSDHAPHFPGTAWVEKEGVLTSRKNVAGDDAGEATLNDASEQRPFQMPKLYLYIQMQLCREASLKDWLMENTLRRDRHMVLDFFDQIVCAVDYIHERGMMHRDLKPSNIFFSYDGLIKVGDFGLATAFEERWGEEESSLSNHSSAGGKYTDQVGTRLYMSPEQTVGKPYSSKVDIYSLGLILFELFFPFGTQSERIRVLSRVRQMNLPARFSKELPDESSFVMDLLNSNPEERPTTKAIQQHVLLKEFEDARQMNLKLRNKTRTISHSSNLSRHSKNSLSSE